MVEVQFDKSDQRLVLRVPMESEEGTLTPPNLEEAFYALVLRTNAEDQKIEDRLLFALRRRWAAKMEA